MLFSKIKGQDGARRFLQASIDSGRIAHAYIFAGPEGIGKKTAALDFARAVNCLASAPEKKPCYECASCLKVASFNHPDVLLVSRIKEDKDIGIDQVRGACDMVSLKPYEAQTKVVIIDGADHMTREAANAFLKTLEEPPQNSVIILIAENIKALLPTVVSRAQIVKFFPLDSGMLEGVLTAEHALDAGKARAISRLCGGSIGYAMKFLKDGLLEKRSSIISLLASGEFAQSDTDAIFKDDQKLCLDVMLSWYRDLLLAKSGITNDDLLVNADRKEFLNKEAGRVGIGHINDMIERIISAGSYIEQNANPKLVLASLALASYER